MSDREVSQLSQWSEKLCWFMQQFLERLSKAEFRLNVQRDTFRITKRTEATEIAERTRQYARKSERKRRRNGIRVKYGERKIST